MTAWAVYSVDNEAHIIPTGDIIDHTLTDECVCGPRNEPVRRGDGSYGWLVAHSSIDGREFTEPDYTGAPMPEEQP
jgi:hypothetical protein